MILPFNTPTATSPSIRGFVESNRLGVLTVQRRKLLSFTTHPSQGWPVNLTKPARGKILIAMAPLSPRAPQADCATSASSASGRCKARQIDRRQVRHRHRRLYKAPGIGDCIKLPERELLSLTSLALTSLPFQHCHPTPSMPMATLVSNDALQPMTRKSFLIRCCYASVTG
jgi:hypothetical protein